MSNNIDSIDPLEAKSSQTSAAAQAAVKREIENILSSYVGWFDPFSELIQNALDSVEERAAMASKTYVPTLNIIIDIKGNSLTVSDNGTGLSKEKYRQFLAPSFSFKSGKTRGHKGVGATFLAYGYNFIQIATTTPDFQHVGKMENARKWLSNENPPSNPLLVSDNSGVRDPEFHKFDQGASITICFDATTIPGSIDWIKAEKAQVWSDLLRLKTGLGAITGPLHVAVSLSIKQKDGKTERADLAKLEYKWPHQIVRKAKKLGDVQTTADKLHAKHGKDYRMPASFRNLDCIYETIASSDLDSLITLSPEEKDIVRRHSPLIYACYTFSARVWSDYNASLNIRGNLDIFKPGIQIAVNNMPHGEIIQIPLKRNVGRQNQFHVVAHFDKCKADLGRKGFQKEIVTFCEDVARKLIEGPFQKQRHALKQATGAKVDLARESLLDDWKSEMETHEKKSPLVISNPNFFLPTKKISITSTPTREQDVIALFHELVAGGVIRGIKTMSTNERFTYDGMYRVSFTPPSSNHIYDKNRNPLGVEEANIHEDFTSKPKILEYKYSLDGLIEDLESGDKNAKDIGLVVVWETGDLYQQKYFILSLLDEDNLGERQYHGITHIIQNHQTSAREMDLIVLSELVEYLNNPKKAVKQQKAKYDDL
jgi:hypothetical protein